MKNSILLMVVVFFSGLITQPSWGFNIFVKDTRKIPHSRSFPLNMIGKLTSSTFDVGSACTASLVGPDLVLTNLHCVSQVLANSDGDITFKLGYDDGTLLAFSTVKSTVAHFTKTQTGVSWNTKQDFALLILKEPLGKQFGWFKVAAGSKDYRGSEVSMAGYSSDLQGGAVLSVDEKCRLYDFSHGFIMHDCASTPGASGSPIYKMVSPKEAIIVALNAGFFTGTQTVKEGTFLTLDRFNEHFANYGVINENFFGDLVGLLQKENIAP